MKQRKPYKTYTREFKQEAVRLMETSDRSASEIAMELGIRRNQIYKWKDQMSVKGEAVFPGNPSRSRKENQSELLWIDKLVVFSRHSCTRYLQNKGALIGYPGITNILN